MANIKETKRRRPLKPIPKAATERLKVKEAKRAHFRDPCPQCGKTWETFERKDAFPRKLLKKATKKDWCFMCLYALDREQLLHACKLRRLEREEQKARATLRSIRRYRDRDRVKARERMRKRYYRMKAEREADAQVNHG